MSKPNENPKVEVSPSDTSPVLETQAITKTLQSTHGAITLFEGVDLSLNAGQSLCIQGTSGAGKSTLLACLAGISEISSGDIRLLGQSLVGLDANQRANIRQQHIGFVFQNFQLLPHLNALENVAIALEISGIDAKTSRESARESLSQVGLGHLLDRLPHQLSGGEQQRVAIARAICKKPAIIFADEPTGNLDPSTSEQIIALLLECQKAQQAAIVLVTHDPGVASHLDQSLLLSQQSLVAA